jgi:hypothetical protein
MTPSRRDFISTGAAAAAGLVLPHRAAPAFVRVVERAELQPTLDAAGRPAVVGSHNALRGAKVA